MKKLLILFTLIFTLMFSSTSFAEWTKVSKNVSGTIYYVDFERTRKHGGYVYFWLLGDYLKPSKHGILSGKVYYQGDCKLIRRKTLSYIFYEQPMGRGSDNVQEPIEKGWKYPPPNSSGESILKSVCQYAK